MPDRSKQQPTPPKSPDALQPVIHGKVLGVTRIGRKAIGVVVVVLALLIMLVVVGIQNKPAFKGGAPYVPAGPVAVNSVKHFGDDVPLGLPTPSPTPIPVSTPPSLPALTNPSPNASLRPASAAPTVSAEELEAEREAAERRAAQAAAEASRRQVLASAIHAPFMMAALGGQPPRTSASAENPTNGNESAGGPESSPGPTAVPSGGKDPNAFLNGVTGQYAHEGYQRAVSGDRIPPQTPYEVVAGSIIPAVLISAINSQNPGFITGQVREDVYDSLTGKYLLIPRGSRLIGVYQNVLAAGQSRILIAWKRLIFPDTGAIDLVNMSGSDTEGNAGFEGRVDTHFNQILDETLFASLITAGLQLSQPQQVTTSTSNGIATTISPGAIAAGAIGQSVAQALSGQIQQNAAIPPTIYIPKGYPFDVVVDRDLVLTEPYGGIAVIATVLSAAALASLLQSCLPTIGPRTMSAIVSVESGGDTNAIHDNTTGRAYLGLDDATAVASANRLLRGGHNVDLGVAQINSANLTSLHMTVVNAFDPCENLQGGGHILSDDYRNASDTFGEGQFALRRAIGAYNTGSIFAGYGYVSSVLAAAGLAADDDFPVPDIAALRVEQPRTSAAAKSAPRRRAGAMSLGPRKPVYTPENAPIDVHRSASFTPGIASLAARDASDASSPEASALMPLQGKP